MLKILLIDDDHEEYELISLALESLKVNAEIIHAPHCVDVHETIAKNKPDILLLDINMPYMNGMECLKTVRSDRKFRELPVIIYSTSSSPTEIENAFKNKANLYLVKPSSFEVLISSLKRVLSVNWKLQAHFPPEKFLIK
jgi:CheY-like chemotaxis protein